MSERPAPTHTYRVEERRTLEITAAALIEAFDGEWEDAQKRGLDEDTFARESIAVCDFDTLADIAGSDESEWDVMAL